MPQYPVPLTQRHGQAMQDLRRSVRKLGTRTSVIDSGFPVAALPAVIDGAYSSGDPSVYLNGATELSGPFTHLASYTPAAGDVVIALPIPAQQTYVILGKLA